MYNKSNLIAKFFALFLLFAPAFMIDNRILKVMAQDNTSANVAFNLSSPHETSLTLAQTSAKKNAVSPKKQEDNSIIGFLGIGGIALIWVLFFWKR
jgi:hypothetical protein